MVYITRKEHFSASHILINPKCSDDENKIIFGKCNELHGHNYYLEITIKGIPEIKTGYVMDLKKLKEIINEEILTKVDHKNLNDVIFFRDKIPTTENMAVVFWNILSPHLKGENYSLYSVKIYETEKNSVIYKGEK
jgi:6-pyruvoyltetrahydropterin/6-carboxytetrahydropterin synthase